MLNTIQEIFLPIIGYEGLYEVSSYGRVRNTRKLMKFFRNNSGYLVVKLTKNGKATHFLAHRLVAVHFLKPRPGANEVNHRNFEKSDNGVDNLEWMTSEENKQHALAAGFTVYNNPSKGKKIGKSSKYFNVLWDKARSKWVGVVRHQKTNYYQKRFDTEEEAALHVNWILDTLGLTDRSRNIV